MLSPLPKIYLFQRKKVPILIPVQVKGSRIGVGTELLQFESLLPFFAFNRDSRHLLEEALAPGVLFSSKYLPTLKKDGDLTWKMDLGRI